MGLYLDIETDYQRRITVLGVYGRGLGLVQLVGSEITRRRFMRLLPDKGQLFTFFGHRFDLPIIRDQVGICLRTRFESCDLYDICRRAGLSGGQKAIERELGITRSMPGMDGRDALRLWAEYKDGDPQALKTLLRYNRDDIMCMVRIHAAMRRARILP